MYAPEFSNAGRPSNKNHLTTSDIYFHLPQTPMFSFIAGFRVISDLRAATIATKFEFQSGNNALPLLARETLCLYEKMVRAV